MTSIGLRPAGLFFSLTGVNTAASISARKLSNGTTRAIISSGSPFAVIAASRLSASKNPNCPIVPTRESCCHNSDSHKSAEIAIFRGPLLFLDVHDPSHGFYEASPASLYSSVYYEMQDARMTGGFDGHVFLADVQKWPHTRY